MKKQDTITYETLKDCFHESYAIYKDIPLEKMVVSALKRDAHAASLLDTANPSELRDLFEVEESVSDHRHTMAIVRALKEKYVEEDPFLLIWKAGICATPLTACILFVLFFRFSILDLLSLSTGGIF